MLRISWKIGQLYIQLNRVALQQWTKYYSYRTSSSICEAGALCLWHLLHKKSPTSILELGTGYSTLIIAYYAASAQRGAVKPQIVSVEDGLEWCNIQMSILEITCLLPYVSLVYAPKSQQVVSGCQLETYDVTIVEEAMSGHQADFSFVDGPPAQRYGGPGREGSIMQAISLTRKNGLIVLHDALRQEEFEIIHKIVQNRGSGVRCIGIIAIGQGLALFEKVD